MKILIILYLLLAISLNCQTYKVDLGGSSNQHPTHIEVLDGDVIIVSGENILRGDSYDAVRVSNASKNKSLIFANSSRQTSPLILLDNNKLLFSHWENIQSGSTEDACHLVLLDKDLNIQNEDDIHFNGDTQVQALFKNKDKYLVAGNINNSSMLLDYDLNLNSNASYFIPSQSSYFATTSFLKSNNEIYTTYFTKNQLGIMIFNENISIIKSVLFRKQNNSSLLARKFLETTNNFTILTENLTKGMNPYNDKSINVVSKDLTSINEYDLLINGKKSNIKHIAYFQNSIYCFGYYLENNLYKSYICSLDSNLNLIKCFNITDFDIIHNLAFYKNNYYVMGTNKNINEYNGEIIYSIVSNIENICNANEISIQTEFKKSLSKTIIETENYSINTMNNSGFNNPNNSFLSSKLETICIPANVNLDFQLLKTNYTSPCNIDSVGIEIVPSSSNINVVWFDGSSLKKRYFSKNGNYKVTLTIPGVKDTTFDVTINSIYKGSASGNLTFTPDTLLYSNSDIDKLTCQTFTLTNVGVDTVTVSELTYLKKLNFSSPNSIFPITLFPKESKDFEVCFYGNKFKTNYSDSIRFDNCNNPKFLTLLAEIPEDTLNFATRCMLKFDAAAPSKSIVMTKSQLNEYVRQFANDYKLSNLLGLELFDINAILPNQLVYLKTYSSCFRILVVE